MAFIEFEKDEEKDNQQQLVNSPSTPQSPHMPQQPQAPQRGLFTNVKQLLKVGQGAGQQMAQRASGLMFQDIQQAASKIGDVKKVQQETEQEKQQFQTDASQIEKAITQARQTNLGNQGELSSVVSDENIDKYHNVVQGQTNLADLQNRFLQQTALTSAGLTQTGQALETDIGTEAGRFNLLRRAIKGPTYTRGQQALDHLLLQGSGGTQLRQTLEEGRGTIGQTFSELQATGEQQKQLAQQFQNLADQTREQLNKLITESEGKTTEEIKKRTENYLKQIDEYETTSKRLLSGEMTLDEAYTTLASQKPELSLFKPVTLSDQEIPIIDHFKNVREFWGNNSINQTANLIVDLNFDDLFYSTNIPSHIKTQITALNDILVQRIQQDPEYQKLYNSILKSSLKPITSRTGFVGMPTFYPIIPTQVQELLDRINARVRQIRSEAAKELLTPRKATAADREYRQAYVDKALRENFGIDTTTDLYTADPASLAKIDRSNLEERVRTKEETAFINALKKLQAGKQAQQLSTENIGQTVSDIIQKSNIKQKIQEDTQKAFQEFLQKLSQHGPIEGHGKAGQHKGFGQWVDHHESVKINPLQTFVQQNPEIIQRMGNTGNRTSGLYDAAAAGLQISNPAFALIPNLANTISDIGSALFGSSAEGARNEAHRYALADAMAKTRELWQRLGHGKRIKFK